MRLLERHSDGELSLTDESVGDIPPYAILSHFWGNGNQEVSFDEMKRGLGMSKEGYQKIQFCGCQAARDGLQYFWVDTCYARWFTRGWTLQELLAPLSVEFFSSNWKLLGDKLSLEHLIHERTKIPVEALRKYDATQFGIEERVSWVTTRQTKHEEDMAYSLLGLCGVFLPLIYGEGKENAFRRLREEVSKRAGSNRSEKLPESSAETQAKFTVPFTRDPKFIGRENIMREITDRLQTQRNIALYGIGGIGKSQIAIEYCYVWKEDNPSGHVFWVHASTSESFAQAYRDIANRMSIPETEDPQTDTLILVQEWLNKPENRSWLIVLDNADDPALFWTSDSSVTASDHRHISDFLPRNKDSIMIVTTRNRKIGQRLTDRKGEIMITPLASKDAGELLVSKISAFENVDDKDVKNLVEILGNIPLAITQAAAFIRENSMTVQTYMQELNNSDSDLQDYLDEDLPDPRRYPNSENSVIRTWKLSFDQIARQSPRSADLLSLMVQLDRQGIQKTLLKRKDERTIEFNKAIGT